MPEVMVLEKRMIDLLSLLENHVGTTTPEVPIVPKPLTPIPPTPTQNEPADKKQKKGQERWKGLNRGG